MIVTYKKPPFWRFRARKKRAQQAALLQSILDQRDQAVDERIRKAVLDGILYGKSYLLVERCPTCHSPRREWFQYQENVPIVPWSVYNEDVCTDAWHQPKD